MARSTPPYDPLAPFSGASSGEADPVYVHDLGYKPEDLAPRSDEVVGLVSHWAESPTEPPAQPTPPPAPSAEVESLAPSPTPQAVPEPQEQTEEHTGLRGKLRYAMRFSRGFVQGLLSHTDSDGS